jgi:hypothetical protein
MIEMRNLDPDAFIEGTVSVNPASINGGAVGTTDVTVAGLTTAHRVIVSCAGALEVGLVPQGASIPSANTLRVRLYNPTGGAVDGAALTWHYFAWKSRP